LLPHSFDRMLVPFEKNPKGTHDPHDDFTILGKALSVMKDHLVMFQKEKFEQAWRTFLREIYATHEIDKSKIHDRDFENAAAIVEETLRELRHLPEETVSLTVKQVATVFMRRLNEQNFHRERTDEIVDLQGWLELPWNDAPFMLIAGMNENFVPGGSLSDAFLPDSLRVKLNLRHDLARFGRDIYLMRSMIETRKKNGRICFISGKTGMTGDPLKPSRLMFRCKEEELPERTELFFRERHDEKPRPGSEVLFKLNPSAAKDSAPPDKKIINVTTFKDYLDCPFRFYLKHMLKMEEIDDEKSGMDALDFGTIIHTVLERMGKEDKLWTCPSPEELSTSLEQLARQYITTRYGSPLPLAVQVSLESAVQRLNAFAHHQVAMTHEGWKIIAVEHRIKEFPYHRGFLITGTIDRIDQNEKTGRIRIMDYKTSDSAEQPVAAHTGSRRTETPDYNCIAHSGKRGTSQRRWINLQLPLYHLLYTGKEKFDPNIELAYFNLPKAVSDTGLYAWNNFDAETMSSAIRCIKGVIEDIDGGKFWPPAGKVKYDQFERLFIHEPEENFKPDLKIK
ncbi:MAG: PD-(D/E)XK nuclease family protein, partial [Kiritimatiellae bacterium]|nr:PD-(D/E)XK nuclease family protein [Kiritimatiellia bacterium]